MHPLLLVLLVGCDLCLGHYRGYEARNLIEREEQLNDEEGYDFIDCLRNIYTRELVECPVCEESEQWMPSNEDCSIIKGGKRYKRCPLGTYINEVCGNRRDCYRGPGEQCTEKRAFDMYGQKCAPGYYCNKPLGVCQGVDYVVDSKIQYILNPTPYSIRHRVKGLAENDYIRRN